MTGDLFIYAGSVIIMVWGVVHIVPAGNVVAGFGEISDDNRRLVITGWLAEGLYLVFTGLLALLVMTAGGPDNLVSSLVIRALAAMLAVLAGLTAVTGARTSIFSLKFRPVVTIVCALLFIAGTGL